MKLYVVIVEDRHADVDCYVFDTPAAAIACAESQVKLVARHIEDVEMEEIPGWLYAVRCSQEGDYIHVVEKTLNVVE